MYNEVTGSDLTFNYDEAKRKRVEETMEISRRMGTLQVDPPLKPFTYPLAHD
jgi:hypothetical protein